MKPTEKDLSTFCPLPWLHLSTNHDESVRICCNTYNGGYVWDDNNEKVYLSQITSIKDYYNNRFMKDLRMKMLRGERHEHCTSCHMIEDHGGRSVRQDYLGAWKDEIDSLVTNTQGDGAIEPRIRYIDFALGNKCNIRCRMCNPAVSNQLTKEFDAAQIEYDKEYLQRVLKGWTSEGTFKALLGEVLLTTNQILITGGEPFITPQHYSVLEKAIELGTSKDITLLYHTNLTTLPQRLLSLWEKFKVVHIHASIEAFGPLNEYIRYPSKWTIIEKNLRALIELSRRSNVTCEVHTTCQAYNMLGLTDLLKFLMTFNDDIAPVPHFILLYHPQRLSIQVLPEKLKRLAKERILSYVQENKDRYAASRHADSNKSRIETLVGYLDYMLGEHQPINDFVDFTRKLDVLRNQNIVNLIPEFDAYFRDEVPRSIER